MSCLLLFVCFVYIVLAVLLLHVCFFIYFFIPMLLLYLCLFVAHVNNSIICVFGTIVKHFNNCNSISPFRNNILWKGETKIGSSVCGLLFDLFIPQVPGNISAGREFTNNPAKQRNHKRICLLRETSVT